MTTLPGGTVTFVFTDIEGSTRLLQELGDEAYGRVSGDHRRLVRDAFAARGGTEIDTQGDAFFFSFTRARDAVAAAVEAQRALRDHEWPEGREVSVRMGLHTGEPHVGEEGYLGLDVVRAARISAAGHGGQILISETTRALLGNQLPDGVAVHDLGQQHLKDVQHEHIYELTIDGRDASPKPLKTQTPQSPKSRQEDMAARFEERITAYVEQQLESAFDPETGAPKVPAKLAFGGAAIGFGVLLMFVVVVVAIVLLVKVVFF
jgi:class 3 adenylate cyclase